MNVIETDSKLVGLTGQLTRQDLPTESIERKRAFQFDATTKKRKTL